MNRLPFNTFSFPVTKIRMGYYSASYFWKMKRILEKTTNNSAVTMQIFNKVNGAMLCGVDEVLALLNLCAGHWKDPEKAEKLFKDYLLVQKNNINRCSTELSITALNIESKLEKLWVPTVGNLQILAAKDGSLTQANKAVITITGKASEFCHLESIMLGILARGTKVATNTMQAISASRGKPIFFFADRFDRWSNQAADGYAAHVGGARRVATNSMGQWWDENGTGTMPHGIIAIYGGDLLKATEMTSKCYPDNIVAIVDFNNDCMGDALRVAQFCKKKKIDLWGIRLDTSENMVDKCMLDDMGQEPITGVTVSLVKKVREHLNSYGFNNIKIVVSGGFNKEKIGHFEYCKAPVDAYGVGSSLLKGNIDYTADIVIVDGLLMAKKGRTYNPSDNLEKVNYEICNTTGICG